MPKFTRGFGRRKSNPNVLEDVQDPPAAEPSFKVFERADSGNRAYDAGAKLGKASALPASFRKPQVSRTMDENMFDNLEGISGNRGSGASNTNTVSTTDSSRLSGASTAPSSTDIPQREEWRTSDKRSKEVSSPTLPKHQSNFSLKAAGRTLSFGRNAKSSVPAPPPRKELPALPPLDSTFYGRERAVTASSYASTATPPKLDERDLGLNLGGDFGDMLENFGKRKSTVLEDNRAMSQSPDTSPSGPASRSYSSNRLNQPSPLSIDKTKDVEQSPYSWSSQHSRDGLISSMSPPSFAPRDDEQRPPVPQHGVARTTNGTAVNAKPPRPGGVAEIGLRRSTAQPARRQSTFESRDSIDEDARLLQESVNANRKLADPSYNSEVRDSWVIPGTSTHSDENETASVAQSGSQNATPRPRKPIARKKDDSMFDIQIAAAANLAERFEEKSAMQAAQNKVMTAAQFERYKQDQERLRSVGGQPKDEDDEDEPYEDEEDETEKNRQLAKQRRKQEAHMAVYRQQMMKVTGETPSAAQRPGVFASQSTPNLSISAPSPGADDDGEEDEEIPLAILQAHGFPNKNRPPNSSVNSSPHLRTPSAIAATDTRLPPFARNLPQDPYFGSSIVHPTHRESFALGGGSTTGGPQRGAPPGGLVGVIATEERSRAIRRGSPNPQGGYDTPPQLGFNGMGMPSDPRASMAGSMLNGVGPMGPMGPMNPMMMTPGDQAQMQMSQQMQQFMQMQMQFMQMMTNGQGFPPQNGLSRQSGEMPRPASAHQGIGHQRAMTMMDVNAAPWTRQTGSMYSPSIHGQGGYAPSIAPSERSNVGLPGRYRPVSHLPPPADTRASTMSGAFGGWDNKLNVPTVKVARKSAAEHEDEDDEEGWEEMKKKREKKKSIWRSKKDGGNGFKDVFNFN